MMDDDDNIIYLFGDDELDDELFHKILDGFVEFLKEGNDFEETCRNYISIPTIAWIDRIGYDKVRENLFGLIVAFDKKHGFEAK